MNEQRRDFFKNSALGLATITLGAGLSLVPSAKAEEKPSNTATTAVENLPEIEEKIENMRKKIEGKAVVESYADFLIKEGK